ncbi:MAG: T9SS type A sorting domain-containing protein [Bacteroidales bacterium]|nr:T9SS type A sorting domain-containing protein [Bacteroidales bacterium]
MRRLLLSFVLTMLFCVVLHGQTRNVLFIGNSYTEVNNLPEMVSKMSMSTNDTIVYQSHTPGGCTFQMHVSGAASYIQQGGWDYVVLQEQSQLPSFPIGQFMSESYPYAQQLCEMIRQYNDSANIVFYMTWGRKNGDQLNAQYYPPLGTYEGMDSLLYARYMMMAEDNNAWVSPVGYVWHYIRDHYPDIELYSSDESHPSLIGTYAAACCFYTVLLQKNPQDISFTSSLSTDITDIVKDVTKILVYDSLAKWFVIPDTIETGDSTSVQNYTTDTPQIWYNSSAQTVDVQTVNSYPFTVSIYSTQGQLISYYSREGEEAVYHFPVGNISDGIYIINYQSASGTYSRKLYLGKK